MGWLPFILWSGFYVFFGWLMHRSIRVYEPEPAREPQFEDSDDSDPPCAESEGEGEAEGETA